MLQHLREHLPARILQLSAVFSFAPWILYLDVPVPEHASTVLMICCTSNVSMLLVRHHETC